MRAFFCDTYVIPLPPGHRFPTPKYRLLRERLVAEGVLAAAELEEADLIDRATLLYAHTPEYVEAVLSSAAMAAASSAVAVSPARCATRCRSS